jgi:HD-like signal output (HDOD) protein
MSGQEKKLSLGEWVRRLNDEEMPVFAQTARSIAAVSGRIETPVAELSHLILQDSSMTTRVLRLANSVYYNPANKKITTVSLAILLLGFDVVRSIALSIAMIDTILKGVQHEHVVTEMARSLHAAVQAKAIAKARGIAEVEEVFIAALLYRIGHMAFWCFPQGLAKELDAEYCVAANEEMAEKKVLGFSLTQFTLALNDEWKLSSLLAQVLNETNGGEKTSGDVSRAYQLVLAVEQGWGSLEAKKAIQDIAKHASLSLEETMDMVQQSAKLAAQTAMEYGAANASKLIHLPDNIVLNLDECSTSEDPFQPDLSLQLAILRELTGMLNDKVDLNAVLGTVLEGVYRGVGMDRVVLAFLDPQGISLKAKYVYGQDHERFQHNFVFDLAGSDKNIFNEVMSAREGMWLNAKNIDGYAKLITPEVKKNLGVLEFFAIPLYVGSKPKGLIYADRKLSGRMLNAQDFSSFVHFCSNANIAFELKSKQQR